MSVQNPIRIYTPNRVLIKFSYSGNHFLAVAANSLSKLVGNILQFLDDFLLHAESESCLLDLLKIFLKICQIEGFRIRAV